jgi:HD-like signal output (HDOD) protein
MLAVQETATVSVTKPADQTAWVRRLAAADIPVQRLTIERLAALAANVDDASPRDVALVVMQDPLMTAKLLAWFANHRSRRQVSDILSIEGTIVMMGVPPFFRAFADLRAVEDHLADRPEALEGLNRVIHRASNAADWAAAWAGRRNDLDAGELMLAALLHDLTEMLMWCFAPAIMVSMTRALRTIPGMRSRDAQVQMLGVAINDLHLALVKVWHLPEMLVTMMDDDAANNVRVRNVRLAVDLARHSENGWDDPALPDDYEGIAALLHMTPAQVKEMVAPREWA